MILNIPTPIKIFCAKILYKGIRLLHLYPGNDYKQVICRRDSLNWSLDLSEGIDLSIYLFGKFEASTSDLFSRIVKPDMVIFDIGANIGSHTLPLARLVGSNGKVFAFEPTDFALKKLRTNLALNSHLEKPISLVQAFVGANNHARPVDSVYASWNLEDKEADPIHGAIAFNIKETPMVTIDEFVNINNLDRVDIFKIDVDGFEVDVVKGAMETIKKFKPIIIIELCPFIFKKYGFNIDELIQFFFENNYILYDLSLKKKYPMVTSELIKLIPEIGSINAVAVPKIQ